MKWTAVKEQHPRLAVACGGVERHWEREARGVVSRELCAQGVW